MGLRPVLRLAELARSNGAINEDVLQCVFRLARRLLGLPLESLLDLLLHCGFDRGSLGLIDHAPRDQSVAADIDRVSRQPRAHLPFRAPRGDRLRVVAERAYLTDLGSRRTPVPLSLIHISEPTRLGMISYAVFCLKKKK